MFSYNRVTSTDVDTETELVVNPVHSTVENEHDIEEGQVDNQGELFTEIRVLDIKGRTFKLNDLPLSTTVFELKKILEKESGVPVRLQRIIHGGRQLTDGQVLTEAKVLDNTVVHLFQRPENRLESTPENPANEDPVDGRTGTSTSTGQSQTSPRGTSVVSEQDLHFNVELLQHRRRIKLLATLLLMVSVLNMVTLSVYLMDALVEHLRSDQWISLGLELVVNSLGVIVGMAGIKGTNTLDENEVRNYCYGLLCVGLLYVVSDLWGLVRVIKLSSEVKDKGKSEIAGESDDTGSSDMDTGHEDKDDDQNGTVGAASFSLVFTIMIWSICFYRAFQFRNRLHVVANRLS